MKLSTLVLVSTALGALALPVSGCGEPAAGPPPTSPTTTAAPPPPPTETATPAAPAAEEPAPPPTAPAPEAQAEKCEGGWVCVKVNLATGKVEPRETKLLGDPKIESTWSKQSDGRTVTFDDFSKGPVELTLRRAAAKKNEVVVKLAKGGSAIVIDKHEGDEHEFTHVGAIAAEKDGLLLVDLRYLR